MVTIFLFLVSFNCPQLFTAHLLHRCSGVPEYACCVNKLRQNVGLRTWIWYHIMTSQTTYIQ